MRLTWYRSPAPPKNHGFPHPEGSLFCFQSLTWSLISCFRGVLNGRDEARGRKRKHLRHVHATCTVLDSCSAIRYIALNWTIIAVIIVRERRVRTVAIRWSKTLSGEERHGRMHKFSAMARKRRGEDGSVSRKERTENANEETEKKLTICRTGSIPSP